MPAGRRRTGSARAPGPGRTGSGSGSGTGGSGTGGASVSNVKGPGTVTCNPGDTSVPVTITYSFVNAKYIEYLNPGADRPGGGPATGSVTMNNPCAQATAVFKIRGFNEYNGSDAKDPGPYVSVTVTRSGSTASSSTTTTSKASSTTTTAKATTTTM
jgi:hypothetical protein